MLQMRVVSDNFNPQTPVKNKKISINETNNNGKGACELKHKCIKPAKHA